jgi:hypothetical protein
MKGKNLLDLRGELNKDGPKFEFVHFLAAGDIPAQILELKRKELTLHFACR